LQPRSLVRAILGNAASADADLIDGHCSH
jgi:hypothetical protein